MEFKGWVTEYSNNSIHGITDDEVATLVSDVERRNKPKSGLIGTKPGRNKEHGRRR